MYPDFKPKAYYRCMRNVATNIPGEQCPYPLLPQKMADALVWERIEELLRHPELLLEEFKTKQKERAEENAVLLEQAESLRAEIHKGDVKLNRLLEIYTDGDIDRDTYRKKKNEYKAATKDAERDLAAIDAQLEQDVISADRKALLVEFCEQMQGSLDSIAFEEKRRMLRILDVTVLHMPEHGKLKLTGTFPEIQFRTKPPDDAPHPSSDPSKKLAPTPPRRPPNCESTVASRADR